MRPRDTRAKLLRAATKAFAEHGFDGTTIDALGEECGVTGGALYRYVESKEELFCRCLDEADLVFRTQVHDEVKKVDDPKEKFRVLFRQSALLWIRQQESVLLLSQSRRRLPLHLRRKYRAVDQEAVAFPRDVIAEVIDLYAADKSINPALVLYMMHGMISWVARWYKPRGAAETDRLINEMFNILSTGLYTTTLNGTELHERASYDFGRRNSLF